MLIGAGCDYAQGNLFSVAVDSEAARAFFGGFRHILSQTSRQENDKRVSAVV
jgi:EAL domain-containing protein (putative c-di-GMP-specific phosphodiesterase class I)